MIKLPCRGGKNLLTILWSVPHTNFEVLIHQSRVPHYVAVRCYHFDLKA
jgi:hypothetical protein